MTDDDETNLVTVGDLRRLLDQASLDDDALVVVVLDRAHLSHTEDDGERYTSHASASKGYQEQDILRIHL